MVSQNSYFQFAENDYLFFKEAYLAGLKRPTLAAIGQSICGRYLKHIIHEYANPENEYEQFTKTSILHSHSLNKLVKYMRDDMGITIPDETKNNLQKIDGFYFTTRYPGDDSFVPDEDDIDDTWQAVKNTRATVLHLIHKIEKNDSSCDEWEQ